MSPAARRPLPTGRVLVWYFPVVARAARRISVF
jgi:hypothetical protein